MSKRSLEHLVRLLRDYYGEPDPPAVTDPLELILWENVAYLVDDQKRLRAFALLKKQVGTTPVAILSAPESVLLEVAKAEGMFPKQRVSKLRTIAELVLSTCDGDLPHMLDASLAQAKKVLRQFPGIGESGAEKILLFSRKQAVLALESNGLRVLLRVGFAEESKRYQATYRAVQLAAQASSPQEFDWLIATHQLLRHHGQMLCKRTTPMCSVSTARGLPVLSELVYHYLRIPLEMNNLRERLLEFMEHPRLVIYCLSRPSRYAYRQVTIPAH